MMQQRMERTAAVPEKPQEAVWAFIRMGRPIFLLGGVVFHVLGITLALYAGAALDWTVLAWTQLGITAVQLMTHYSNEYYDLAADRANRNVTRWAGGSRVLPDGLLPPWLALGTAVVFAGAALTTAGMLYFVYRTGPWTLPLFLLALALGWSYSSPPLRLHTRGLGEMTTAVLVSGLTPLVGYYTQSGGLSWLPLLAVMPLALLQLNMTLAVHFPDVAGDTEVGKRTLIVRLGDLRAAQLYVTLMILAYAAYPLLVTLGLPGIVAGLAYLGLPLGLWLLWRMQWGDWAMPSAWDRLAFWSIGLLMGTAVLQIAGFLLLTIL